MVVVGDSGVDGGVGRVSQLGEVLCFLAVTGGHCPTMCQLPWHRAAQDQLFPKRLQPEAILCLHQLAAAQPGQPRWLCGQRGIPCPPHTHVLLQG